ncbi:UPF0149 family protein [Thermodesulfovibrio hydrogeniphilus]
MIRLFEIFNPKQKELLQRLISLSQNKDKAFTLPQLEGFLYGIAIVPDMILPSEWLDRLLGVPKVVFNSETEMEELIGNLFEAYNIVLDRFNEGSLKFPYNVKDASEEQLQEVKEWLNGFISGLMMRKEIWIKEILELTSKPEDLKIQFQELFVKSFFILSCFIHPKELEEESKILENVDPSKTKDEIIKEILPVSINIIIDYAKIMQEKLAEHLRENIDNIPAKKTKVGRNDPCPCGSGKKYKKCCGK